MNSVTALMTSQHQRPHIHRPTASGVKKRAHKLHAEMAEISGTGGHHALEEWDWLAEDLHFEEGLSFQLVLRALQKYAIPLIVGVLLSMVLKNTVPDWFDASLGPHHPSVADAIHISNETHIDGLWTGGGSSDVGGDAGEHARLRWRRSGDSSDLLGSHHEELGGYGSGGNGDIDKPSHASDKHDTPASFFTMMIDGHLVRAFLLARPLPTSRLCGCVIFCLSTCTR
jgi:hypothetical protein